MSYRSCAILGLWLLLAFAPPLAIADEEKTHQPAYYSHKYTPPHLSKGWHALFDSFKPNWEVPDPHDLETWKDWDKEKQAPFIARDKSLPDEHGVKLSEFSVGDVRVVEITPAVVRHETKALLYMHGGGWVSFSPESTWIDTVPMAAKLGVRVFSVDYSKAPVASIYDIIDENVAVFEHVVANYQLLPRDIGLYGCSAGGHLTIAVSNALRNRGLGIPGAAVASSPMVDFTMTNDTWITLEGHDPVIAREAYVRKLIAVLGIDDYRDPVISPQFDSRLGEGMPPTLIQTGGKEVLLGDSLVMFQALEAAGQIAKLDVYDGMPHCFPFILPDSPEGKTAYAKQVAWFVQYLALE